MELYFLLVCKFPFMLFKLNCSECPCGTGDDNFCNSISKEYFVHLNKMVSMEIVVRSWQNTNESWGVCHEVVTPPFE